MVDPTQIASLVKVLGITGFDPTKVAAAMELAQALGGSMEVPPEEYIPEVDEESFYLPKVSKNFYYNPEVFRKLHSINYEGLRRLVIPNLKRLRR